MESTQRWWTLTLYLACVWWALLTLNLNRYESARGINAALVDMQIGRVSKRWIFDTHGSEKEDNRLQDVLQARGFLDRFPASFRSISCLFGSVSCLFAVDLHQFCTCSDWTS